MANSASSNELHSITKHNNIVISGVDANEVLKFDGSNWINQTLAESGIAPVASPTFTTGATSPAWITGNSGTIKLVDGDGNHFTTIAAHATTVADVAYTWPNNAPSTSGFALTSTTGGEMSWAAVGGVDTSGTPADSQIAVFTDADTVEGDANLTYGSPLQGSNSKALNIVGAFADYSHGAIQIKTTHTSNTQGYNGISFYQNDNTLLATFRPGLTSNDSGSLSIGTIGNMYFSVGDPNADSSAGGRLKIYAATGDVQVKENDSMPSVTKGILKAWVQSTASGSRTGSYNVPGVIDNGTGDWQVTFEPDMESATYALAGLPINGASDIILRAADTTNADRAYVHAIVGGSKTDTAFMILAAGEVT